MVVLANRIAFFLSKNGIIEKDDEPIYVYGAEVFLNQAAAIIATLIIGLLSGQMSNLAIFMTAYFALRGCAGGYHASSHLRCFICSVFICIVNVVLFNWVPFHIKDVLTAIMIIVGSVTLIATAPSQNLVNPKTIDDLRRNKMKMIVWIIVLTAAAVALWLSNIGEKIYFSIACAFITVTILSGINSFQYILRRKNDEERIRD